MVRDGSFSASKLKVISIAAVTAVSSVFNNGPYFFSARVIYSKIQKNDDFFIDI
jgi:hypothetical protein